MGSGGGGSAAQQVGPGGLAHGEEEHEQRPAELDQPFGSVGGVADGGQDPEHAQDDQQPEHQRPAARQEQAEQERGGPGQQDEHEGGRQDRGGVEPPGQQGSGAADQGQGGEGEQQDADGGEAGGQGAAQGGGHRLPGVSGAVGFGKITDRERGWLGSWGPSRAQGVSGGAVASGDGDGRFRPCVLRHRG